MDTRIIKFGTYEYEESLQIRDEVLRKPWGRSIKEDDLSLEESIDVLIGAFEENILTGVIVLHPLNNREIKIKYLCVYKEHGKKGIGKKLVKQAEKYGKSQNYDKIVLDSRITAMNFYENLGYVVTGKEFMPEFVEIRHIPMKKLIVM